MDVTRRDMLKGAGILAAGLAATGAVTALGCASESKEEKPEWLPEVWDAEADIVIVGHGGAGAAAAITAVTEELGDVYVMDVAPEGMDGGNSKVSSQLMFIPTDVESGVKYQTALNDTCVVEEDILRGWAKNLSENKAWLEGLGFDVQPSTAYSPEFPEIEGSEACKTFLVDGVSATNHAWLAFEELEKELGIAVNCDTRAIKIIRNPLTNEALGVQADQGGTVINVKARKGVILSCGGFENNLELKKQYLPLGLDVNPIGTPYNRGDGFALVAPFGAQLWHTNNIAGTQPCLQALGLDSDNVSQTPFNGARLTDKGYIFVGANGSRYVYEELSSTIRHGKVKEGDVWVDWFVPEGGWVIFNQSVFDDVNLVYDLPANNGWAMTYDLVIADNQELVDKGIVIKCDTIEDMAKATGISAEALQETLSAYNGNIEKGLGDPVFQRGTAVYDYAIPTTGEAAQGVAGSMEKVEKVAPFDLVPIKAPYYVSRIRGGIYNTQGGPKRNGDSQVLDHENNPIPRLYGAGEFGAIYSNMYNGGGNFSEALASGRAAARHAATLQAWDAETEKK